MAKEKKKETYIRFGWLRFTRAGKDWRCARGKYCENDDLIDKGSWHASVALGRPKQSNRNGLSIVRHLHIACLSPWAEYQTTLLDALTKPRGRPKGSVELLLTPEERTERRRLIDRRKYLLRVIASTKDLVNAARRLQEVKEITRSLGKPATVTRPGLSKRLEDLSCSVADHCEPDEDRHCIHCLRCFDPKHVHIVNLV